MSPAQCVATVTRLPSLLTVAARVRARTWNGRVLRVAETLDGTVVGFEIKAGREVDTKSLRGLITLRESLGDQFRAGYFLNTGSEAYQIDDRIHVCPIDRLWQTNGSGIDRVP